MSFNTLGMFLYGPGNTTSLSAVCSRRELTRRSKAGADVPHADMCFYYYTKARGPKIVNTSYTQSNELQYGTFIRGALTLGEN